VRNVKGRCGRVCERGLTQVEGVRRHWAIQTRDSDRTKEGGVGISYTQKTPKDGKPGGIGQNRLRLPSPYARGYSVNIWLAMARGGRKYRR